MIKSTNNPLVKKYRNIFNYKTTPACLPFFILTGYDMTQMALNAGIVKTIIYSGEKPDFSEVKYVNVSPEVMYYITNNSHLDILAVCSKFKSPVPKEEKKVLILDNLRNNGNLGKCIFLAWNLGYDAVYLSSTTPINLYSRSLIKFSHGAALFMPLIEINTLEIIHDLKKKGFTIIATTPHNAYPLSKIDSEKCGKTALILGNEVNGVCDEALEFADIRCTIEMNPNYESMNVACAAAIVLYHFRPKLR